jgi:hypothetical protein
MKTDGDREGAASAAFPLSNVWKNKLQPGGTTTPDGAGIAGSPLSARYTGLGWNAYALPGYE